MLYTLLLNQSDSGIMIYKQSFEQKLGEKSELFSSFFSAIQTFVKQMILKDTQSSGLESINLGQYLVSITKVGELNLDCIMITDQEDRKEIKKFVPKLLKNLKTHKVIFDAWDGDVQRYRVLDVEIIRLLAKFKKLSGLDSANHDKSKLMAEILGRLPELEKDQIQLYTDEKHFLEEKFIRTTSFYGKLDLLNSIQEICRKLRNQDEMAKLLKLRKKTISEMNIVKEKLSLYIVRVKTLISSAIQHSGRNTLYELDYRDAYLILYSLKKKLELFGFDDLAQQCRKLATVMIEKPPDLESEFPQMLQAFLKINEKVFNNLPNQSKESN